MGAMMGMVPRGPTHFRIIFRHTDQTGLLVSHTEGNGTRRLGRFVHDDAAMWW